MVPSVADHPRVDALDRPHDRPRASRARLCETPGCGRPPKPRARSPSSTRALSRAPRERRTRTLHGRFRELSSRRATSGDAESRAGRISTRSNPLGFLTRWVMTRHEYLRFVKEPHSCVANEPYIETRRAGDDRAREGRERARRRRERTSRERTRARVGARRVRERARGRWATIARANERKRRGRRSHARDARERDANERER